MFLKNKPQITYYRDRCPVQEVDPSVSDNLVSKYDSLNGKITVDFCGVVIDRHRVFSFLPVGCENHTESKVRLLLKCLVLYSKQKTEKTRWDRDGKDWRESEKHLSLIGVLFEIVDDFRRYGLYCERQTSLTTNRGTPDWARTFKRTPYISRSGKFIYPEIDTRVFTDSHLSFFSQIHNVVLRDIAHRFGGNLLDPGFNISALLPPVRIDNLRLPSVSKSLKRIKSSLFSVRSQRLHKLICSYIEDCPLESEKSIPLGIRRFEYLWEHMLRETLESDDLSGILPVAKYISGENEIAKRNGRLDIFLSSATKDHVAVVDAKYYGANSKGDLPGWGDIVKQLYYEKLLPHTYKKAKISNWFVFPGREQYVDKVRIDGLQEEYNPIGCKYVTPEEVMEAYLNRTKLTELRAGLLGGAGSAD